jgi:uncharacterized protein YidB (DUF937 family)
MAKGSPSLVALLGLLAVAGYQHRDKLGELLNGQGANEPNRDSNGDPRALSRQSGGLGDLMDRFGDLAGGAAGGGLLGGLSELFERFTSPQQQAKAQSWVRQGRNQALEPDELATALDEETIAELVEKTGLSRSELLSRLSMTLPEAVDQVTPEGHFPPISAREPRPL